MFKYYFIILSFLLIITSCVNKNKEVKVEVKKTGMSLVINHTMPKKINADAVEELKDWTYYKVLNGFLMRFENISATEALSNALELKELVRDLKENIRFKELQTPAFNARLNVLENEIFRLADMTYIPAITAKEVNSQVDKILMVFGSLNAKINTTYNQKRFNEEVNLDSFFKLDSTKAKKTDVDKKRFNPVEDN